MHFHAIGLGEDLFIQFMRFEHSISCPSAISALDQVPAVSSPPST